MIERRDLLKSVGACCACGCGASFPLPAAAQRFRSRHGCVVRGSDAQRALGAGVLGANSQELPNLVKGRSRTTGDVALNRSLDAALRRLAKTFGVWPQVGFYDDGDQPNSMAIWYKEGSKRVYGVVFGRNHFRKLFAYDASGITFLQTAAHEFGHVVMYQSGTLDALLKGQPTVKRAELHADFLSGYYLGLRKRAHPEASFRSAGMKRWESGDTFFGDPQHHGSPKQRLESAEAGFLIGYRKNASLDEAFRAATAFVQRY